MGSSMPGATRNFITLATAVLPDTTSIYVGKIIPKYTNKISLQVYEVEGQQLWGPMSPEHKRDETFNIKCRLWSYIGDQDFLSRMKETFDAFDTITIAVANDPTLTGIPGGDASAGGLLGTVRVATINDMVFSPEAAPNGKSFGMLTFDVACQQRITTMS